LIFLLIAREAKKQTQTDGIAGQITATMGRIADKIVPDLRANVSCLKLTKKTPVTQAKIKIERVNCHRIMLSCLI